MKNNISISLQPDIISVDLLSKRAMEIRENLLSALPWDVFRYIICAFTNVREISCMSNLSSSWKDITRGALNGRRIAAVSNYKFTSIAGLRWVMHMNIQVDDIHAKLGLTNAVQAKRGISSVSVLIRNDSALDVFQWLLQSPSACQIATQVGSTYYLLQRNKLEVYLSGGAPPIHFCCLQITETADSHTTKFIPAVDLLLSSGYVHVDSPMSPSDSRSPLVCSILTGNHDMMLFLLSRGANINYRDEQGNSCLHFSATQNDLSVTKELLDRGLDVNYSNLAGNTPLMNACFHGLVPVLEMLLMFGANPRAANKAGLTAMEASVLLGPNLANPLVMYALSKAGAAELMPPPQHIGDISALEEVIGAFLFIESSFDDDYDDDDDDDADDDEDEDEEHKDGDQTQTVHMLPT